MAYRQRPGVLHPAVANVCWPCGNRCRPFGSRPVDRLNLRDTSWDLARAHVAVRLANGLADVVRDHDDSTTVLLFGVLCFVAAVAGIVWSGAALATFAMGGGAIDAGLADAARAA